MAREVPAESFSSQHDVRGTKFHLYQFALESASQGIFTEIYALFFQYAGYAQVVSLEYRGFGLPVDFLHLVDRLLRDHKMAGDYYRYGVQPDSVSHGADTGPVLAESGEVAVAYEPVPLLRH